MYTELQTVSNFSFLRGASHPAELMRRAAELGYRSLAVTDHHSLAGIVRAHTAAKQFGISLLVGCRVQLASPAAVTLLLYPTCVSSYGNLCSLLTYGKRRTDKGSCLLHLEDLTGFSKGLQAAVDIKNSDHAAHESIYAELKDIFDEDRLSVAVARHYEPRDNEIIGLAKKLSLKFNIPLLAANDVHYHISERRRLQDVLCCIRHGCTIDTAGHLLFPNAERTLKPPHEMQRLFKHLPSAVGRTAEIEERVRQFSLDQLNYEYPQEICPEDKTPLEYLKECTESGAQERYPQGLSTKLRKQLNHEFKLIEELDYAKYFLTVLDIVSFARSRGILCQGRGAAANSAVCYCLGITAVDPGKVDILFERFISKERNEPPDIDIDFEHERREEVIQYIYRKYGRHRAALVAEVVSYRGRSAIRDVGKALGLSLDCVDLLAKSINRWTGRGVSAELVAEAGLDPNNPRMILAIELAQTIKGFPRHLSQHVGGFVITDGPLSRMVPIENAAMAERTVIEWDKDDIDAMGMLKIDILGLGMLTCIRKAFELINRRTEQSSDPIPADILELHNIPAEDPRVYDMICLADTIGVFQIESRAQMSMLPRLRPRNYYDLVIEVAIVRPGPIQGNMIHPYLRRRSGREKPNYPNEQIEQVLKRTLGVPIFQEQAMQLAIVAAGFSPGEADALRRSFASWKTNSNIMDRFGKRIVNGMKENGYSREFIETCFEQLQGFGEYGFPESHAASFALLVYISAWLKCHHPAAFAAALINSQPMGFYQPAQIVNDAAKHGVEILPIDVNHSCWNCSVESGKPPSLRLGLRLVRSLSREEAGLIEHAVHSSGPYHSLGRLWRDSGAKVHTLRCLARADAFSSLSLSRQRAMWEIRSFRDAPLPLFEKLQQPQAAAALPKIARSLQVQSDYHATGLSLKAHPVSFARGVLDQHKVITAEMLKDPSRMPSRRQVVICGMLLVRQAPPTAGGVLFMTIEDETGIANLVIKPHTAKRHHRVITTCSFILASGIIERRDNVVHMLVDDVADVSGWFLEPAFSSRDFH